MHVSFRLFAFLLFWLSVRHGAAQNPSSEELYYFFDKSPGQTAQANDIVKVAVESGFRIRSFPAKDFPKLTKTFRVRSLPSLVLLQGNRLGGRLEGQSAFSRFRELYSRVRESVSERRGKIRELLTGLFNGSRDSGDEFREFSLDGVVSPPLAPRYIQTGFEGVGNQWSSVTQAPKPLDRQGKFPVAHLATSQEQIAYHATVRLRVVDSAGTSHGSGTVIHSKGRDALVLTCGHIFRDSGGKGRIEADVFLPQGTRTVEGILVSYDSDAHDVALVVLKTPSNIPAVNLSKRGHLEGYQSDVFTVGCDQGRVPSIRRSHYKRQAIYDGVEKHDVYGRPMDGRSGGGLFNQQGDLIGVCNAAAVHVDEGIYSGLKTIYRQLTISRLVHLFERGQVASALNGNGSRGAELAVPSGVSGYVPFVALPKMVSVGGGGSGPKTSTAGWSGNRLLPPDSLAADTLNEGGIGLPWNSRSAKSGPTVNPGAGDEIRRPMIPVLSELRRSANF
ncbi:MAG: serine protease [Planctomycetota bacterium]|nr:serine protease [Planctomycetota bacterium]